MNTKHTPGPWEVAGDDPTLIIIESKNAVLCSVNWYPLMKGAPTRSECKANGKLIAAAPELLTSLKEAVLVIKNWHSTAQHPHEIDLWKLYLLSPEMKRIIGAIEKAEVL